MGKLTIVQANQLVDASYSLSINELRIIALASTKVDSRKKNIGAIRIDVAEFVTAYSLNDHRVYENLRDAVRSLMRKPIRLVDSDNDVIELAWLVMNKYNSSKNGTSITVEFSPKIEPYLFELKERFTAINFEFAAKLNTPFSFRLYQWLYKAKNMKGRAVVTVQFDVDWMKQQGGIQGGYERWDVFKDKVIEPAINKINSNTDLSVCWVPIKKGRKIHAVEFSYVVEVDGASKPLRPRLFRRPKVVKGSHEEGIWMRKNLSLLLEYEKALKAYDASAKLALTDLRKMSEYASIAEPELKERLAAEINQRTQPILGNPRCKKSRI